MNFDNLVKITKRYCGVNPLAKTRKQDVVYARMIMYKIMREFHGMSYETIGGMFGKTHATILHSVINFNNYYEVDLSLRNRFNLVLKAYSNVEEIPQQAVNVYENNRVLNDKIKEYEYKLQQVDEIHNIIKRVPEGKMEEIKQKLKIIAQVACNDIEPRNEKGKVYMSNSIPL